VIIPEIPNINHIRETESNKETTRIKSQISISISDNVTIDEESRFVARLIDHLKKLQLNRDSSIDELKQKIQNGEYNPSSEEIAKAILYGPPRTE